MQQIKKFGSPLKITHINTRFLLAIIIRSLFFPHGPSADSAQNNEQQHCNCRNLFVSSSCSSSIFCFLVEGVVVIAIVVVVVSVSVLVSIIITILLFLLGPNWVDKHFLTTKGVTKGFLELILIPEGC